VKCAPRRPVTTVGLFIFAVGPGPVGMFVLYLSRPPCAAEIRPTSRRSDDAHLFRILHQTLKIPASTQYPRPETVPVAKSLTGHWFFILGR
jgi:hypothetical protein